MTADSSLAAPGERGLLATWGMVNEARGRAEYVIAPVEGAWVLRMKGDSQTELFGSKEAALGRSKQLLQDYDSGNVTVLSGSGAVEMEYVHDAHREA